MMALITPSITASVASDSKQCNTFWPCRGQQDFQGPLRDTAQKHIAESSSLCTTSCDSWDRACEQFGNTTLAYYYYYYHYFYGRECRELIYSGEIAISVVLALEADKQVQSRSR